jgi:thiol-activated cytolysin
MKTRMTCISISLAFTAVACGGGLSADPPEASLGQRQAAIVTPIDSYIDGLGALPPPPPDGRAEAAGPSYNDVFDSQVHSCATTAVTETKAFGGEGFVGLDPNADALFPGELVQTHGLDNGQLNPYDLSRSGGNITITGANISGSTEPLRFTRTVSQVTLGNVSEAIARIVSSPSIHFAARAELNRTQASSLAEAALTLGMSVNTASAKLSGSFGQSWTDSKSTFLLNFTQAYYTASFERQGNPASLFAPSVLLEDVQRAMRPGNPPAYIASVTYGRRLLMKLESNESSSALNATLNAAFNSNALDANANLSLAQRQILTSSSAKIAIMGGDSVGAIELLTANGLEAVEAVKSFLREGAAGLPSSVPVPLSFVVRHLSNNQLVTVSQTSQYTIPNCVGRVIIADVDLNNVLIHRDGDGLFRGSGEIYFDVFVNGQHPVNVNNYSAADGTTIPVNHFVRAIVPMRNDEKVTIRFTAQSGNKQIDLSRDHFVSVVGATGQLLNTGNKTLRQAVDNFDAELRYTLTAH